MSADTQTGTYGSSAADTETLQPFLSLVIQGNALTAPALRLKLLGTPKVIIGRGESRSCVATQTEHGHVLTVRLADERVSSEHCEIVREPRGYVLFDRGSKNGTRVNGHVVLEAVLHENAVIEVGRTTFLFSKHPAPAGIAPILEVEASSQAPGFATLLPTLARQLTDFHAIAASKVPVLVRGETGTGKELAASALHTLSKRSGPFIAVNCGALPATLAASELFGAKKGAFSGATEDRLGLVRASERGTLFLDEVGDLQPDLQAALLRVLQENEVLPLGATKPVIVDTRIVAATHRDLEAMVAEGTFRQDLLARLSGYTLRLPALRARREDVGLMVSGIVQRRFPNRTLTLRSASVRRLFASAFERNVRELEQALIATATLSQSGELDLTTMLEVPSDETAEANNEADLKAKLELALRKHKGNVSAVAAEFGKARMQIQRWLKRFSLDPKTFT